MRHFIAVGLIFCASVTSVWADGIRAINTTGLGVVQAEPDMATLNIGVTHQALQANSALGATSKAVRAVLDRLTDTGIDASDMQTSNLSLQPIWSNRVQNQEAPPRVTGFSASNTVNVRVRDLSILGSVLDAVVRDGANTFGGLNFAVQDPAPLLAEARALAVRDGMERAQQLADAAGVSLGAIQSVTEGGGARSPQFEMSAARMSDVPIAAGELSFSVQVSMVFAITE